MAFKGYRSLRENAHKTHLKLHVYTLYKGYIFTTKIAHVTLAHKICEHQRGGIVIMIRAYTINRIGRLRKYILYTVYSNIYKYKTSRFTSILRIFLFIQQVISVLIFERIQLCYLLQVFAFFCARFMSTNIQRENGLLSLLFVTLRTVWGCPYLPVLLLLFLVSQGDFQCIDEEIVVSW